MIITNHFFNSLGLEKGYKDFRIQGFESRIFHLIDGIWRIPFIAKARKDEKEIEKDAYLKSSSLSVDVFFEAGQNSRLRLRNGRRGNRY
jgi:hypothetical protein